MVYIPLDCIFRSLIMTCIGEFWRVGGLGLVAYVWLESMYRGIELLGFSG